MPDVQPPEPRFSTPHFRLPRQGRIRLFLAGALLTILLWHFFSRRADPPPDTGEKGPRPLVKNEAAASFLSMLSFDSLLPAEGAVLRGRDTVRVRTTAVPALQRRIYRLMEQYRPLFGAAVVFKPRTGEVLAAVSYKNPKGAGPWPDCDNLVLWSGFPAASLFKIITAAGAMEERLIAPEDKISFSGANHTLYRYQLDTRRERWGRKISLREAFYRSINPPFGIVGQMLLGEERMNRAAGRFLFNVSIPFDLPVPLSQYEPPIDAYQLAEVACGFNRRTTLSPVHGALIAGAVGFGGKVCAPYLIREVVRRGKTLYTRPEPAVFTLASPEAARLTRGLMEDVVERGTARKSFLTLSRTKSFKGFRLGGKTGSIDGEDPKCRYDWFAGFAIPGERPEEGIAMAVVTAHGPYWTVHSSYIAAEAIRIYYSAP